MSCEADLEVKWSVQVSQATNSKTDWFENLWFDLTQHDCLKKKAEVLMQQGFAQKKERYCS